MKDLLEAGVHFGHQTKRWNPKMKEFIFGERNGIYIIDLNKTVKKFRDAEEFVTNLAADGKTRPLRRHQAPGAGRHRRRSAEAAGCTSSTSAGSAASSPTSPRSSAVSDGSATSRRWSPTAATTRSRRRRSPRNEKEKRKLLKNLEGIRHMSRLPDAIFVVDTRKEKIAVDEARKLKIPVIGIVDTNCDPDEVDFVIPGNDDALRAIRLFASKIAEAVIGRARACANREWPKKTPRAPKKRPQADAAARLTRVVRPQRRETDADPGRRIGATTRDQAPARGRRFLCTGHRAGVSSRRWYPAYGLATDDGVEHGRRSRQTRSSSFATRPARA